MKEDLISRQEVIDEIRGWQNEDRYYHPTWKHDKIPVEELITGVRGIPGKEAPSLERDENGGEMMFGVCPYECSNKTEFGYCKTTGCINPKFQMIVQYTNSYNSIPSPCGNCPNHPQNGGGGVCHCILGVPVIT